jgi:spore germination protein GerM
MAGVALVGGCGVESQERSREVDAAEVPFGLLESGTTTVPERQEGAVPQVSVELCFVDDEGDLVVVSSAPAADSTLLATTRLLVDPPDPSVVGEDLSTSIAESDAIRSVDLTDGVAEVELDPAFTSLPAEEQAIAVAQLVCTLTGQAGVGQVGFAIDETAVEVPRGDGSLTRDLVARADYAELLDQ